MATAQRPAPAAPQTTYGLTHLIPLRQNPEQEDGFDPQRIEMVRRRFHAQDGPYLGFAKTVEEHIRMLCGRQWDVWSDLYGRFVDTLQFMTENERKWRMRPVMDYLGYWFVLTTAKAIENRPVITFVPSTSDRMDALLAEVMDPIWKTLFDEMEMDQRRATMVGWLLAAGEGYYHTRADFQCGERRQLIAPAELSLTRPGQDPISRTVQAAPYDQQGNPLARLLEGPDGEIGYDVTGDPYEDLEGSPRVEVLCPLQVRAQWGNHLAWRDKRWIAHEWFLLPEQVYEQFGVVCQPDHTVASDEGPGYLERMLFGTGYYGATQLQSDPTGFTTVMSRIEEGYVRGITLWEKPIPKFTDETEESAGGRLLVVAPGANKCLWDSARPFRTECAGPIRRVRYIEIPGRPTGTTMLEKAVPLQKRLNRVEAHIAQHTNLCVDPILLVHEATGIDPDQWVAQPGVTVTHGYNGPGAPAHYLAPPALSTDVWKHKADLREQLFIILSMAGNQSESPTATASGELVEQLRVNADRPLTPLTQALAKAESDVAEDVLAILPTIWTEEKLIGYAGADNVVRTVKVLPEMFEGRINVRPSLEAASAESKDSRRSRLIQLFQLGAFGDLADPMQRPKAIKQLLELINFPDLTRASRPGGVDRVMAEHNVGKLIRGELAPDIPLLPMYNYDVHLEVVDLEMIAPEYWNLEPQVREQFVLFRELLLAAGMAAAMEQLTQQVPLEQARAAAAGAVEGTRTAAGGPPSPGSPAGPGGQKPPAAGAPSPSAAPAGTRAA